LHLIVSSSLPKMAQWCSLLTVLATPEHLQICFVLPMLLHCTCSSFFFNYYYFLFTYAYIIWVISPPCPPLPPSPPTCSSCTCFFSVPRRAWGQGPHPMCLPLPAWLCSWCAQSMPNGSWTNACSIDLACARSM
jgi:hypothetical protein